VFRSAYPREFDAAYAESFGRWSTSAVPAIGVVRLLDGNDDGVFEPGERVIVDVELINFGGAPGRFTTSLNGVVLSEIDSKTARLPRRSAVIRRGFLEAVIDSTIRPRTRTELMIRVGDEVKAVKLRVNRPLEWVAGSLRLLRDNLDGRVRVELDVRNLSRRDRAAQASLTTNTREDIALSQVSSSLSRPSGRPDLLEGLSSDVMTLVRDLPGPHPLLRKYVKRLARRLP